MFLSDREMAEAIANGQLIIKPPTEIGPTSIDLHLDDINQAKIWDTEKLARWNTDHGLTPRELRIGQCNYGRMSKEYHVSPPDSREATDADLVVIRGEQLIVKPHGFVLWQTKEVVGTPEHNADLICFVNGKSTRARTGLVVHLTAPTIHTGWYGRITLEMTNLGPLDIVLEADDVVAQVTVAQVTSTPIAKMTEVGSSTFAQSSVAGAN